ncbi:actin family [Flagelloscypha sp. PMI_526]|nr:actin family [Flagelloscypha sp. PMI_526]
MDEWEIENDPTVIICNGSWKSLAGFSGDASASSCYPTIVGRARQEVMINDDIVRGTYVGSTAQHWRSLLDIARPMERGIVTHWDDMEVIWRHALESELHVSTGQYTIMHTDSPINPQANRERMAERMFEAFSVPAFYVATNALTSLFSSGRTTGLVLDAGEDISHSVPIYEGSIVSHAVRTMEFGGADITKYLLQNLAERRHPFRGPDDLEIVRDIKHQLCYIALDFGQDIIRAAEGGYPETAYNLPDGRTIVIGNERSQAPEALFQPSFIDQEGFGIHEMILSSICNCDFELHRDLWNNIILAGGNTMFPGIAPRLQKEMVVFAPPTTFVKVVAPPERKFSSFMGASILTSLDVFRNLVISKDEFQETGPNIVRRRCL